MIASSCHNYQTDEVFFVCYKALCTVWVNPFVQNTWNKTCNAVS